MSPIESKKRSCRPVELKGQWPYHVHVSYFWVRSYLIFVECDYDILEGCCHNL